VYQADPEQKVDPFPIFYNLKNALTNIENNGHVMSYFKFRLVV